MKTKLVKSMMAPLLGACALVTLVAAERAPQGRGRRKASRDLEHADNSKRLRRSYDKELSDTSSIRGGRHLDRGQRRYSPGSGNGGKGVWSHTTDSTYAFRFKDFNFNAQNVFTGWTIITGETTVDETGNANAGPATVEVYNASGVLVASLSADAVGTRFEL